MGRLLDEDDVVDWLLKRTEMYDGTGHFVDENVVKKNIESQIAKIPTAQPERPIGEWIVSESEEVGALGIKYKTYTCPSCGWSHSLIISMNFCPNCGNDNRGEQDE